MPVERAQAGVAAVGQNRLRPGRMVVMLAHYLEVMSDEGHRSGIS